eukprot:CAMPEP_0117680952 /NCGR_PEP_ID=MMETSP0804-20121206/18669_1 /TAXON_ID=1074897 /ORGANISM="Tetraselmis astigmatica, Strain CCMP880" /LENGTH=111 /DNA_ID=CAMNT_0005490569 /DNA_START=300 /DNA_END=635 /DNA_ORIENTATION=+
MLLQRDVAKAAKFYSEGLGLQLTVLTERWAELKGGPSDTTLALKAIEGEAFCTVGYSPFLQFTVEDMDSTLPRLLSMGATLDGPVKYPVEGKVAALRAPDGHMIGLYEPAR